MEKFEQEIKEIDTLYAKAVEKEDYEEIIEKARELEEEMQDADASKEEITEGIYSGFYAEYFWVRKFASSKENVVALTKKVKSYYLHISETECPSLKIKYGYLLAVIESELKKDSVAAEHVRKGIQKIAKETGDTTSILRVINVRGLDKMKREDFEKAIEIFNEIKAIGEIPENCFRHAGNIVNNRGAARIRGDVDPIEGAMDLMSAAIYYLQEEEPSQKHLEGIRNRLGEARKKLE